MPSPYYCDPAAPGINDGSSWTNAWINVTSYLNAARTVDDICYARGTQTIASADTLGILATNGTGAQPISLIGCSAAGTPRAGNFVIQGKAGDLPVDLLNLNGKGFWNFENITFQLATTQLIHADVSYSQYCYFKKCLFQNSSGNAFGVGSNNARYFVLLECVLQNNTLSGVNAGFNTGIVSNCEFLNNGANGYVDSVANCLILDNIFYNNTLDHIDQTGAAIASYYIGNVFHTTTKSAIKIVNTSLGNKIFFNKILNSTRYGIEVLTNSDATNIEDYNYFGSNTLGDRLNCAVGLNSVQDNSDSGMINPAGLDFRTTLNSKLRRIILNMDWHLATANQKNIIYPTAGLPPTDRVRKNNRKG